MPSHPRALLAPIALAALALTFAVAGCGGSEAAKPATTAAASAARSMPGTATLADATRGDMVIGLEAMAPETFFVAEGTGLRRQAPGPRDRAHMMVTLTDRASGIRLPDATVTLRLTAPGGSTVFDGPLYPMIGRGMGMHYGENVALPASGSYTARLVVGPPRIGRHLDAQNAWTRPVGITRTFTWDGRAAHATS